MIDSQNRIMKVLVNPYKNTTNGEEFYVYSSFFGSASF